MRGSDLSLLKNQIFEAADQNGTTKEKAYFRLLFEDLANKQEVAASFDINPKSIDILLKKLRNKILIAKPFLATNQAIKYKGAGRILKMLAVECDRNVEAHSETEYSYTQLFNNISTIIEENGTLKQKEIYNLYFVKGETQTSISQQLNVVQNCVWKHIYGNYSCAYEIEHGGIISKVGKELRARDVPYCCHLINPYGSLFKYVFKDKYHN